MYIEGLPLTGFFVWKPFFVPPIHKIDDTEQLDQKKNPGEILTRVLDADVIIIRVSHRRSFQVYVTIIRFLHRSSFQADVK